MACRKDYYPSNRIQYTVGDPDSYISNKIDKSLVQLPNDGDTQLIINISGIINDSAELWNDGGISPRELTDRESYDVLYDTNKATFNFYPNYRNGQVIVIRFDYVITTL